MYASMFPEFAGAEAAYRRELIRRSFQSARHTRTHSAPTQETPIAVTGAASRGRDRSVPELGRQHAPAA